MTIRALAPLVASSLLSLWLALSCGGDAAGVDGKIGEARSSQAPPAKAGQEAPTSADVKAAGVGVTASSSNQTPTPADPAADVKAEEVGVTASSSNQAPAPAPADPATFLQGALFRVDLPRGMFVGELVANAPLGLKNPSEYCLADGHLWRGAAYRLGDTNLFDLDIDAALAGKSVIVYGEERRSLDDKIVKGGPCPADYGQEESMMQLRSDWMSPECGFSVGRSTHEKLKNLSYISAAAVFELSVFTRTASSDATVTLTVRNPFNRALDGAQLQAHYEYRRGKPAPHFESHPLTLEPGQSTTIELPRSLDIPGAHRGGQPVKGQLHDVTLMAMAGSAELSLPFRP